MTVRVTIRDVLHDLLAWAFPGDTWAAWHAFLAVLYGLPLTDGERAVVVAATGRTDLPCAPFGEAFCVGGRRSGKSRVIAAVAVFEALFGGHDRHLAAGERGVVLVLAQDRDGARVCFGYIAALIQGTPHLAAHVLAERAESLDLDNGLTVEVGTSDHASIRGKSIACLIADEVAFWSADASDVLGAARPGMATIPGAKLLAITSPWARRGAAWEAFKANHGRDGAPVLVWHAPTTTMNPSPEVAAHVAKAYEADPLSAATEYGAAFRSDVSAALPVELIEAAVEAGVMLREPMNAPGSNQWFRYVAFFDGAGAVAGGDSLAAAVAHMERDDAILDAVLEIRPPYSHANATAQVAALLKRYRISVVTGDRYAGQWPVQEFAKHEIAYQEADQFKSDLYVASVPLFTSGRVRLLDCERLLMQLRSLERIAGRNGREKIDHPPGRSSHDDLANAACGALVIAARCAQPTDNEVTVEHSTIFDGYDGSGTAGSPDPFRLNHIFWH